VAKPINFTLAALLRPANLVLLISTAALSLVAGSVYPALAAALGEGLYLGFWPQRPEFRRALRRRKGWGSGITPGDLDRLADNLSETGARDYRNFRNQVNGVVDLVEARELDGDPLFEGVLANLQAMSLSFLKLLLVRQDLNTFVQTARPAELRGQLTEVEQQISMAPDAVLVKALEQNRDLLLRRLKRRDGAEEQDRNIAAQLDLMESTVRLVREQTASLSSPAVISNHVETVMANLNAALTFQESTGPVLADEPERVAPRGPQEIKG